MEYASSTDGARSRLPCGTKPVFALGLTPMANAHGPAGLLGAWVMLGAVGLLAFGALFAMPKPSDKLAPSLRPVTPSPR